MKTISDGKSGTTISYDETLVTISITGISLILGHDEFRNLLTFLNKSDIIIGRERSLDDYIHKDRK